ncbi:MAG TPA: AraC family transcriptional regulator [Gemmatimonadaceae bacterium]|nr:AraC family transcriptional regulator [Gemmatimonadaceae bacterium]
MKSLEFPPDRDLADFIQLIWVLESEQDGDVFPRELIMPDGIVEIVFHHGAPFYTWQDGNRFLQPQSFAISMMRKHIAIESSGRIGLLAVRCFPWGGYHFFTEPVASFLDQTIPCDRLWKDNDRLVTELSAAAGADAKVACVQRFLRGQLALCRRDEPAVIEAIKLIRQSKGQLSIDEVCARTGFSQKQLSRKMTESVGVTPKVFSRVTRFLDVCSRLDELDEATLSRLPHDCGFHDQAHFIKEFKAFSGFTPKEFFKRKDVVFTDL